VPADLPWASRRRLPNSLPPPNQRHRRGTNRAQPARVGPQPNKPSAVGATHYAHESLNPSSTSASCLTTKATCHPEERLSRRRISTLASWHPRRVPHPLLFKGAGFRDLSPALTKEGPLAIRPAAPCSLFEHGSRGRLYGPTPAVSVTHPVSRISPAATTVALAFPISIFEFRLSSFL
jgi:hypothetical protein